MICKAAPQVRNLNPDDRPSIAHADNKGHGGYERPPQSQINKGPQEAL
tara:strand:- start:78 stop:221 length:144 start_codon:yes stop_codon:yes gene_type:complete